MSGKNGDKARHYREIKKKNLRQKRTRELRNRLSGENQETRIASPEVK